METQEKARPRETGERAFSVLKNSFPSLWDGKEKKLRVAALCQNGRTK